MTLLLPLVACVGVSYIIVTTIYNLFFHPLRNVPGPFLCRISSFPSFYHACKGDRHIWSWQQFQLYGRRFRAAPNLVLFNSSNAYNDIFSHSSNVKKSNFYDTWVRNAHDINTLSCTDVREHARKRRLLTLAFTEHSVKAAGPFMSEHTDRWNELTLADKVDKEGWTLPRDMARWTEYLIFDMLGDLCFGVDFRTKEAGENKLKEIPHFIAKYMSFTNPITKSPLLEALLWLKPRGLNDLMEILTPKDIKAYYTFVEESATKRIEAEKQRAATKGPVEREDMFHFLCTAKNPDTGAPAFTREELIAESNLLIVAGSDTTATALVGLFFYLIHNRRVYEKLNHEIRTTFSSPDEIVHGPKLANCKYLRACIEEAIRISPPAPSELPREILSGGQTIDGEFYTPGTIVGTPHWALGRNEEQYPDPVVFRPERWIVSDNLESLNTEEDVRHLKRGLHTFLKGPGNCIGQNLAMLQMTMTVARTLWRMDIRLAPETNLGGGRPELGWGRRDPKQYQLRDAFVSLREGPMVQFRKRTV